MTYRILLAFALIATIGLAACGRKSSLDTPYQAALDRRKEARDAGEPVPPAPEKPVRDRPFILDRLIE